MEPTATLPHDFPDRAIRDALEEPHNLRDLLARLDPDLAARLDFDRREVLPRSYLLEDWRRREGDLLVRVPYRNAAEGPPLLVCILVEHQSTVDPVMPLRLLVYAVLYWDKQWQEWEKKHKRGEPLRLTPVIPVVFHTGPEPWDGPRTLSELFEGAEIFAAVIPQWQTWFCDLATLDAAELARSDAAWWQALAVLRAEYADLTDFTAIFQEALRRLGALEQDDKMRWHQLLRLVFHWSLFRRPQKEHDAILEAAKASQASVQSLKEVEAMSQQVQMNYEQELIARTTAQVTAGVQEDQRELLKALLEDRFQQIPDQLRDKIEKADLATLRAALRQVVRINALEELQL